MCVWSKEPVDLLTTYTTSAAFRDVTLEHPPTPHHLFSICVHFGCRAAKTSLPDIFI